MSDRMCQLVMGVLVVFGLSAPAAATTIHEEINAPAIFNGSVPPEALGSGIDQIHGRITGSDEGDLYRVYFGADGLLRLRARTTSGPLNPSLFLFDSDGKGLFSIAR